MYMYVYIYISIYIHVYKHTLYVYLCIHTMYTYICIYVYLETYQTDICEIGFAIEFVEDIHITKEIYLDCTYE